MGQVHEAISAIMADMEHVGKNRKNPQQGYSFRGIDDVYCALQKQMAKHGVFTTPEVLEDRTEERETKSKTNLIYRVLKIRYTFFAGDGSSFPAIVIGEGMDSGDKASNKAMAVAHKYALLQVFCIPTEEAKDPETESHEVTAKGKGKVEKPEPTYEPVKPNEGAKEQVAPTTTQIEAMIKAFSNFKVTEAQMGEAIGRDIKHMNMDDFDFLKKKYIQMVKDKSATK